MNNYYIEAVFNNQFVHFSGYDNFTEMFESFLQCVEETVKNKLPIDKPVLTYKDTVLATDVQSIVKIGASILNLAVNICSRDGKDVLLTHLVNEEFYIGTDISPNHDQLNIKVVSSKNIVYKVFVNPVGRNKIRKFFMDWRSIVKNAQIAVQETDEDHIINPVLQQKVDMNWTMEYYAPAELKKALALIDTNPAESKKILMVMDYMLSSKVNIQ